MKAQLLTFAALTLSQFSGLALAQSPETFVYPKFFAWSPIVPNGWDNTDPYMRQTIYVEAYDSNNHTARSAAVVAQEAATAIIAYRGNFTAAERPICLFLKNVGRDFGDADDYATGGGPIHNEYPLRFFRVEDRLKYVNTNTPRFDDDTLANNPNDFVIETSARWYRHPFLANAGANAPMKAWFSSFVVALKAALPNGLTPERIYLDTEPAMAQVGSQQSVRLLKYLMTDYNATIWNNTNYRIPAWGNMTLEELYQIERDRQISELGANHPNVWPLSSFSAGNALNPGIGAWDAVNNSYTLWWETLTARVEDYVMWNCFYSVAHSAAGWPQTNPDGTFMVRCGNYDDFRCDGATQPGRSGWTQDRVDLPDSNKYWNFTDPVRPTTETYDPNNWTYTKSMPRLFVNREWGGIGYHTGKGVNQRYLHTKRWALGDVDSPYFYGIANVAGEYPPHYHSCRRNDLYGIRDANGDYLPMIEA